MLAIWPLTVTIANRLDIKDLASVLVAVGISVSMTGLLLMIASSQNFLLNESRISGTALRCSIALFAMLSPAILTRLIVALPDRSAVAGHTWSRPLILALFAVAIPAVYVDTVSVGFHDDLEKALQSRRFALARRQAAMLAELNPSDAIEGKPIRNVRRELTQIVASLEAAIRPSDAGVDAISQRRNRITVLMQLDRNEAALRELEPFASGPGFDAISLDYRGLCYQRLERYSESLDAYRLSVTHWQSQPASDRQRSSLASGWKGIGYAARQLNQRTLEEDAYRELVRVSPTADHHLMLAQCYREHQKTGLATQHLLAAEKLNPQLQSHSSTMLKSMSTDHFGCWLVPRRPL